MADELSLDAKFTADTSSAERNIANLVKEAAALRKQLIDTGDALDSLSNAQNRLATAQNRGNTLSATNQAYRAQRDAVTDVSKATRDNEQALKNQQAQMGRTRYALYDVAYAYGAISAALLVASGYAVKTAADFESSFTNVQRTLSTDVVPAQVNAIRDSLIDLSTTIPKTFDEITKIATLGNQLGIAQGDIENFTRVVSEFSTVTGISVEETAQAFGKLGNLLNVDPSNFEQLGSAIALVGKNSAATEPQIVAVAMQLAAVTRAAGFTAAGTIALSGAFASLGVAPESARSAISQFSSQLNRAVAEGGTAFQNFATITGTTTDELDKLVRSGDNGEKIFRAFLQTLSGGDTVQVTQALDALGLSNLRVDRAVKALTGDLPTYDKAIADANDQIVKGTELSRQYAFYADDLNTQFNELVNSVNALVAELSGGLVPGLAGGVSAIKDLVNGAREAAKNPLVRTIAQIVIGLGTLVGVLAGYRAVQALATASTYALVAANTALTASGGAVGVTGLLRTAIPMLFGFSAATTTASAATVQLTGYTLASAGSMRVFAVAANVATAAGRLLTTTILPLALILAGLELAFNFQGVSQQLDSATNGVFGLQDALRGLGTQLAHVDGIGVVGFENGMVRIGDSAVNAADIAIGALSPLLFFLNLLGGTFKKLPDNSASSHAAAQASHDASAAYLDAANSADTYSGALDSVASSGAGAADAVRTLVDYSNDLSKVYSRAFSIRFDSQSAIDQVTTSFQDLTDRIEQARISLLKLTADRSVKEYFLTVANAYGDSLRAGVLTGEIADINSQIANTQADATTELTGNTRGAIKNRKAVTDLVKQYEDYIGALASSGADQDTLNNAVAQSRVVFLAQAQALGFSTQQLEPYVAAFSDVATSIALIPRNITVNVSADPAITALNELEAAARSAGAAVGGIPSIPENDSRGYRQAAKEAQLLAAQAYLKSLVASGNIAGAVKYSDIMDRISIDLLHGNYWSGGFTGQGGKYQPAGIVHKGEYVVPKEQVNQSTGLPYANALGKQYAGSRNGGFAGGGYVSQPTRTTPTGAPLIVVLDAGQYDGLRRALAAGGGSSISGQALTNAVAATNQTFANLGRG